MTIWQTLLIVLGIGLLSGSTIIFPLLEIIRKYTAHEVDLPVKVKSKSKKQRFYIQHVIYKNTK